MKPARFHPEALAELEAQSLYYEERSPGLGLRFLTPVEAAVRLAESMPQVGSPHQQGTRRVFPKSFPCAIVYREMHEALDILAVAPFRRKPGYWRSRK